MALRFIDEQYLVMRVRHPHLSLSPKVGAATTKGKSALDFAVLDASAALPQNCQPRNGV